MQQCMWSSFQPQLPDVELHTFVPRQTFHKVFHFGNSTRALHSTVLGACVEYVGGAPQQMERHVYSTYVRALLNSTTLIHRYTMRVVELHNSDPQLRTPVPRVLWSSTTPIHSYVHRYHARCDLLISGLQPSLLYQSYNYYMRLPWHTMSVVDFHFNNVVLL